MVKKILIVIIISCLTTNCNQKKSVDKLENDDQKAAYAIGIGFNREIADFEQNSLDVDENFNKEELIKGFNFIYDNLNGRTKSEVFGIELAFQLKKFINENQISDKIDKNLIIQGFLDKFENKKVLINDTEVPIFLNNYMNPIIEKAQKQHQDRIKKRGEKIAKENLEKGKKFLEANKKKIGIFITPSGIQYKIIKKGDETTKVKPNEIVSIKFIGTLMDGTIFDSTEKENMGNPVDFPLTNVIPGLQEVLTLMSKGSKYKVYIPSELAYGEQGGGTSIGPNQPLIFDIELIDIKSKRKKKIN